MPSSRWRICNSMNVGEKFIIGPGLRRSLVSYCGVFSFWRWLLKKEIPFVLVGWVVCLPSLMFQCLQVWEQKVTSSTMKLRQEPSPRATFYYQYSVQPPMIFAKLERNMPWQHSSFHLNQVSSVDGKGTGPQSRQSWATVDFSWKKTLALVGQKLVARHHHRHHHQHTLTLIVLIQFNSQLSS